MTDANYTGLICDDRGQSRLDSSSVMIRSPGLDPTVPSLGPVAGKGVACTVTWFPTANSSMRMS
jgi:hypothetical protein